MRKKIIILFGIILPIVVAIGYPLIKRYYLYPKNWKQKYHDGVASQYKGVSDDRINQFTDCVYNKLVATYGVFKIPAYKDYTKEDLRASVSCLIDNLIDGDSMKNYQGEHLDDLINSIWKTKHPKNN